MPLLGEMLLRRGRLAKATCCCFSKIKDTKERKRKQKKRKTFIRLQEACNA